MRDCLDRIEWWLRMQKRGALNIESEPSHHELRIKVDTKNGPIAALIDTKEKAVIGRGSGPTVGDALARLCDEIGAPT